MYIKFTEQIFLKVIEFWISYVKSFQIELPEKTQVCEYNGVIRSMLLLYLHIN